MKTEPGRDKSILFTMKHRLLFLLAILCSPLSAAEQPNVVFILCDDLGINDLACYGRAEHQTPHLDKLAREGLRFTAAYSACPVCSPTRAAIMTGKNPARLHLTTFLPGRANASSQKLLHPKIAPQLPLAEVTLAERFKAAGYVTGGFGKWHLGFNPKDQGFDVFHAGRANTTPGPDEGGKGEYDLTYQAVDFISANKGKPFFLYLAHNAPHIPLSAKRELIEKYAQTFNPVYAAMINSIDDSVGRLLSALDRQKLTEKTIVIFTSDNGGVHVPEGREDCPTHNTPYRAGKGFLYEGGLRVPLIVKYPGVVPAGKTSDQLFISTDWMLTLSKMCSLQSADLPDGQDMSAALKGGSSKERKLYWHFPHYTNQGSRPGGALLDGDFKFILNYEDDRSELYNLGADPSERHDLAPTLTGIVTAYRTMHAEWRKSLAVQENTANPGFDAAAHKALYEDVNVSNLTIGKSAAITSESLREWRKRMDEAVRKK